MYLSRRQVLAAGSASLLVGACTSEVSKVPVYAPANTADIGLQTYTLRHALDEDFVGTFQMIKDVGYDFVELNGGNLANHSPAELRKILDDVGLPSPATHVDYYSLSETPEAVAEMASALQCEFVILPWVDENERSPDDYKRHAEMLNRSAEVLAKSGLQTAYHNHQFEFDDLGDGQTGLNILLTETDPDKVDFELDFFWAALGQADIPALIRANPGRFRLCHIKDMKGDPAEYRMSRDYEKIGTEIMVNVGEGNLPFETYLALNDVSGMTYMIAEHDHPPQPYRQSIATSLETIRNMRF